VISTGALIDGGVKRHLLFDAEEHPVAVQLGGSDPAELATCSNIAEQYGYDEINLNIGCPSERVQKGAFGACLMAEPKLVAQCVSTIKAAVKLPVTVKHRTGVDSIADYEFLRNFVATIAEAGCTSFIVHARNAILKGLSPKENREVPPLKYNYVYRLKSDFPQLEFVINGGISSKAQMQEQLAHVDGVMLGRAAYHNPWLLADEGKGRPQVVTQMMDYARSFSGNVSLRSIARHMLGLYFGHPHARLWRRMLSDSEALKKNRPELLLEALEAVEGKSGSDPDLEGFETVVA
jgi:tRNA-dihydrouridine synthase A